MSISKKILSDVIEAVSIETDVPIEAIMSKSKENEVVDARHICIILLRKKGLYISRIAELMRMTTRNVLYVISAFDDRLTFNRPMRNNYERAMKRLGSTDETTPLLPTP